MNIRTIALVAALVLGIAAPSRGDRYVAEDVSIVATDWSFDGGTFTIQNDFNGIVNDGNVATVFESWSLSFTSPDGAHNLTPLNSEVSYDNNDSPDLDIMLGEVRFPASTGTQRDALLFSGGGVEVKWTSSMASGFPLLQLSSNAPGSGIAASAYGEQGGVGLIATVVPEPTSASYLVVAGMNLLGFRILRRRR